MALTFDESYQVIKRIGPGIGRLMKRGDKMAKDLVRVYADWYQHEHARYVAGIAMPDTRRRRAVVSALDEFLKRELTEHERIDLMGRFGHLVDQDKIRVQVAVALALRH